MGPAPVVTGISPKEGPPGTRVTIRGEFLGSKPTDLVGLTICDSDCLLSAEWKSSNKIIARSGPGKGRGDIVVTTLSGGRGTCTVQFRAYHETIGPLKESAVWVEEAPTTLAWGSRALSPSSFHVDDPLGLSVEGNDKKMPEDDLQELFPGCNGDLSSELFSPGWFLLEHHSTTSFDDLRVGLTYLKRKVDSQKQGQLTFLKGNVGSVMDQLETLEALKAAVEKDIDSVSVDCTSKIESAINESIKEGKMLFEGVLKGREKADRTRNALGVLQRFKFLFSLPASLERNMKKGEYDAIISDYSRAKNLFGKTEVNLFKKVLYEVELKLGLVKETLKAKLHQKPLPLDEQKKIIRNLVQLEYSGDPGWEAINVHTKYINDQLNECYQFYHSEENVKSSKGSSKGQSSNEKQSGSMSRKVQCIEDLVDVVMKRLPDLWSLGQSYFNGELSVKPDPSKHPQFKRMVTSALSELSKYVSLVLSEGGISFSPWLPHCLRKLRSASFPLDLPTDPLDALIFKVRMQCVKGLLHNCSNQTKSLAEKETWVIIYDPNYGAITKLPGMFEDLMKECIASLKEAVTPKSPKEGPVFESDQSKSEVISLIQGAFNNYLGCLEALGTSSEDNEQSMAVSQLSAPTFRQLQSINLVWEERLLSVISNCRYSEGVVVSGLSSLCAKEVGLPELEGAVVPATLTLLKSLQNRLVYTYLETKSDPLVGTIEPSMYIGHFEWDTDLPPSDVRPYAKEIIANITAVHSELEGAGCSWLLENVIGQIVETVGEELCRLMVCVPKMSPQGAQQATLDISALQHVLQGFITPQAQGYFNEAIEVLPVLSKNDHQLVDELLEKFKSKSYMQLLCFTQPPSSK